MTTQVVGLGISEPPINMVNPTWIGSGEVNGPGSHLFCNDAAGHGVNPKNKTRVVSGRDRRQQKKSEVDQTVFFPAVNLDISMEIFWCIKIHIQKPTGTGALLRHPDFFKETSFASWESPIFFSQGCIKNSAKNVRVFFYRYMLLEVTRTENAVLVPIWISIFVSWTLQSFLALRGVGSKIIKIKPPQLPIRGFIRIFGPL